jgi:hypothetical protein
MQSPKQRRSFLNRLGIGILIVGMGTGEFIYTRSLHKREVDDAAADASPYDSRTYKRSMERVSGKFGALMDRWMQTIAGLGEPKPLAITIGAISMLTAGGCFLLAARMKNGN